eukprot:COSAG02_NODE_43526_length_374_cov_0.534545_1_plen_85_part_10
MHATTAICRSVVRPSHPLRPLDAIPTAKRKYVRRVGQPVRTLCIYTDGGYDPPKPERETKAGRKLPAQDARAGYGAEMWYRGVQD